MFDKFPYSLKYVTPSGTARIPDVRIINKHSNNKKKKYQIHEDTFVIVPSVPWPQDKIMDPDSGRLYSRLGSKGKNIMKYFGTSTEKQMKEKLCGKMIYIPFKCISKSDIKSSSDGINLTSKFMNSYVSNNKCNTAAIDIGTSDVSPMDIIRIAITSATGRELKWC